MTPDHPPDSADVPAGGRGAPEANLDWADVRPLLAPDSVAIVGASPQPESWSGVCIKGLRRLSFPGRIYPVNPRYAEIDGLPCYPSLDRVPGRIDLVLLFVAAARVPEVLESCGAKGVRGAVVLAAGFGETGGGGAALEERVAAIAARHGIRICGPNCMGLVNLAARFMAYTAAMIPDRLTPGRVALISQSGQLAAVLFVRAHDIGLYLRYLVSTGNELNTEAADFAHHLLADAEVRVITLILEGLRRPAKFLALAEHARRLGKPLIVLKLGNSEAAGRLALAHTGKLAGAARSHAAVLAQYNAVQVDDPIELVETALLFDKCPAPGGERLAIVAASGGWCGVLADLCAVQGLELARFAPGTRARLAPLLDFTRTDNPLDTSGQMALQPERWAPCLRALLDDPESAVLVVVVHQMRKIWRDPFIDALLAAGREHRKPIVVLYDGGTVVDDGHQRLIEDASLPVFRSPQPMLRAIHRFLDHHRRRRRPIDAPPPPPPGMPGTVRQLLDSPDRVVPEHVAKRVLGHYGIPVVEEAVVTDHAQALAAATRIGYPVVLKAIVEGCAHKLEAGLVRLDLRTPQELSSAFAALRQRTEGARAVVFLVQRMVTDGIEVIAGIQHDPDFGPMIMVGLGGIRTEFLDRTALRRAPLTPALAAELIGASGIDPLLKGAHDAPAADRDALIEALLALSRCALECAGQLDSIDINPLLVLPAGQGCVAVDALLIRRQTEPSR